MPELLCKPLTNQALHCSIVVDIWYAQLDKGPNSDNGRECEINNKELNTPYIPAP